MSIPRCAFCGHADPADLVHRLTEAHGPIWCCTDAARCLDRVRPQLAAALSRQDAARRPRK